MNSLWDIRIFLGLVPKESHCISRHYSRTALVLELFGHISGITSWRKCHVLALSRNPTPLNPFLSFFLYFFAQLHLARFSWKLTVARVNTLLRLCSAVSPCSRKSCSFEMVKVTRRNGRSTADAPWVLRIRHIEPFRVPIQLGLLCSHCSGHIHVCFFTFIPTLPLLKSVLLKSVFVQAVLSHEYSMVPLFLLSILVEKSKRQNGKFGDKFPFLCVLCDFFLTSSLYLRFLQHFGYTAH